MTVAKNPAGDMRYAQSTMLSQGETRSSTFTLSIRWRIRLKCRH
jgi:hypothetical protein